MAWILQAQTLLPYELPIGPQPGRLVSKVDCEGLHPEASPGAPTWEGTG